MRRASWQEHVRRGIAIGLAASLHLLVLLLIAAPMMGWQEAELARPEMQRLQLRLFGSRASASKPVVVVGHRASTIQLRPSPVSVEPAPKPTPIEHAAATAIATPIAPLVTTAPPMHQGTDDDGGFHQRLLQSQTDSATRGVPGSDRAIVSGIRLIDPDTQGIGAVMRKAQRLFGVRNPHCADVEVWGRLSPKELGARHMSSGDLDRLEREYHCGEPLGLNF